MKNIITTIKNYIFIGIGIFLVAFGLHFFLFPNKIASGGITGFALIINSLFGIKTSIIVTVGNVILFLLAFMLISGEFGTRSIYAAVLLSVILYIFEIYFSNVTFTNDLILASIFGSVLVALGSALSYIYEASTGGTSIIGRIINKYYRISFGMSSFIVDATVTILAIYSFGTELALYGVLSVYLIGFLIDKFIDGFNSKKQIIIITDNKELILNYILVTIYKGCTVFEATGGYSKEKKAVLLTVLNRTQFIQLRKFLKENDPQSLVTVTETTKVFGEGFEKLH